MHGIRRIFRAKLARAKLARKAFFVCVLSAYSYLLSSIFFLYVVRDDHSLVRHRPFNWVDTSTLSHDFDESRRRAKAEEEFGALNKNQKYADVNNEPVLVVIISDRLLGIITTIASIVRTSSKPVHVVLIGSHEINLKVREHFGNRLFHLTSLSTEDVTQDLLDQGLHPIWTWDTWHTTINNSLWMNENTIRVSEWDNLMTHAHELNHIRFYLPHLSVLKTKKSFFFLDDDILVQKDLSSVANRALQNQTTNEKTDKQPAAVFTPCNLWKWQPDCLVFEFQSQKDTIFETDILYGGKPTCKGATDTDCVPKNYRDILSRLVKGSKQQPAWNFGFSMFVIQNWLALDLTGRYESVMKESYRHHIFPETSLSYGLGVAFLAFAGAVECWKEDILAVRDGFGFIGWDRFTETFGENFFKTLDVVHYTGPDKPWVHNSSIETRALAPWLTIMEKEKLSIPEQLPAKPTAELFVLLASTENTGASFIMSTLDKHPDVCAGENGLPDGFTADALRPQGVDWFPACSRKVGCTFEFVQKHVLHLVKNIAEDGVTPEKCLDGYQSRDGDPPRQHLKRLCNFAKKLGGNFTTGALERVWVDAFMDEDQSLFDCKCVRGVKAKVLKIMAEWITYPNYPGEPLGPPKLNFNGTKLHGSKIIRLKRKNLWARYKSKIFSEQSKIFHPSSPSDKQVQYRALQEAGNVTVDLQHLKWHLKWMDAMDRAGDEWASDHASSILWLDYEDCRNDTKSCFERIHEFLGVDSSHMKTLAMLYESTFASMAQMDNRMDFISNKELVVEFLGSNGYDQFVEYKPIQLLLYQEDEMLINTRTSPGINTTFFGYDRGAEDFGSKLMSVMPLLSSLPPESIVVIGDARNTFVDMPMGNEIDTLSRFKKYFSMVTDRMGAVVFPVGTMHCSSAFVHVAPGDLFTEKGNRKGRACSSKSPGCTRNDSENKTAMWSSFMRSHCNNNLTKQIFLDTSMLAGKAINIQRLLKMANLASNEDEQAVFSDLFYHRPDLFFLDYDHLLFGSLLNARQTQNVESELARDGTSNALFKRNPEFFECGNSNQADFFSFPAWKGNGINPDLIFNHIDQVFNFGPILSPEPELLYYVDNDGIWSCEYLRSKVQDETRYWRMTPVEEMAAQAHKILIEDGNSPRWGALKKTMGAVGFPIWLWYGDSRGCSPIPIFTNSANRECKHAFPIPSHQVAWRSQESMEDWVGFFDFFEQKYPWKSKIRKAAWRGTLEGSSEDEIRSNVRMRLNKMVRQEQDYCHLYDSGVTSIPEWVRRLVDVDAIDISEFGGFVEDLPQNDLRRYVAVLDMDGYSWTSTTAEYMSYNSVLIKIEPNLVHYFWNEQEVKPWVHYVPVKSDLSDLHQNVAWALDPKNEDAVLKIILAANQLVSRRFLKDRLASDLLDIWEAYIKSLNVGDGQWQDKWNQVRTKLTTDSKCDLMKLS